MLKALGDVLTTEDGHIAKVTPLKEDREALASIVLSVVIFAIMLAVNLF